jgi:hypothetical protein
VSIKASGAEILASGLKKSVFVMEDKISYLL